MRNRILAVLFLAILAILAGWFIFKPARKVEATALVEKEDLVLTTSISGKLKASRAATLSFPISGKITQIASVSAAVAEGGILATLDTFDLYAAYRSSLFSLSKSYSSYYNAVEAKAELDATYAGREGDNIVKAKLAEGRTDVEAAAAAVDVAKAAADQSLAALSKGTIRAPFSGTVVESVMKVGEVAAATVKALTLADLSSFYFEAEVDEIDVAGLKVGQDVSVELDAYRDRKIRGQVSSIDSAAHLNSSGGTSFFVKIDLEPDPAVAFRSGLNGEAKIVKETRKDVLVVPTAFVYQKNGKNLVTVIQGKNQLEREIELGEFAEGNYEVTKGLEAGEVLVRLAQ